MNLTEQLDDAKLELQISPLIDVVFLLLIYFIVTAQIVRKEGDIPFMLPADVPHAVRAPQRFKMLLTMVRSKKE